MRSSRRLAKAGWGRYFGPQIEAEDVHEQAPTREVVRFQIPASEGLPAVAPLELERVRPQIMITLNWLEPLQRTASGK